MSLATILPFLEPIRDLLADFTVSEIMINGNGNIFFQRDGRMWEHPRAIEPRYLETAVKRIARALGKDIGPDQPILDARLSDGSRVAAVYHPCSLGGVTLTIRKFHPHWFSLLDLVKAGTLSSDLAENLAMRVAERETILIAGAPDTGKTTFTKALIDLIPRYERLGIIEDTAELLIEHQNVFRFEAQKDPPISTRDLVKASLRHRPDRLIIGEVRGAEAFDLIDALNIGQSGSICTIHANSALLALNRLATLALYADVQLPHHALQAAIGDLIDVVIYLERRNGVRQVAEVLEISEFIDGVYRTTPIFMAPERVKLHAYA